MKMRSLSRLASIGLLASLCLTSSSAEALLAGVKGLGRAGTQTAYPDDTLCVAFNPAGEAFLGTRLDFGAHVETTHQSAKVSGNHATIVIPTPVGPIVVPVPGVNGKFRGDKTKTFYAPEFGFNKEFGCCNEWSVGIALYNRDFLKTTYRKNFVLFGTSHPKLEYVNEQISPFITYKLNNCHALGVALNINVTRFKAAGLQNIAVPFPPGTPQRSKSPKHVTNREYAYSTGVGVTIGYLGRWTDWLSVGVAYTPQTRMPRYHKYKGFLAESGKLNIPERWNAGVAIHWLCNSTIALDYEYDNWNKIRSIHNKLNLPNPFNPLLGTRHGTGFGWKSQNFIRVGIDYRFQNMSWCWLDNLTVRAGYRWASKLFGGSQTVVNQFSLQTSREVITAGFTYNIGCHHEFSGWYGHVIPNKIKGHHSIPAGFGGGEADLKKRVDVWGLSYGYVF